MSPTGQWRAVSSPQQNLSSDGQRHRAASRTTAELARPGGAALGLAQLGATLCLSSHFLPFWEQHMGAAPILVTTCCVCQLVAKHWSRCNQLAESPTSGGWTCVSMLGHTTVGIRTGILEAWGLKPGLLPRAGRSSQARCTEEAAEHAQVLGPGPSGVFTEGTWHQDLFPAAS